MVWFLWACHQNQILGGGPSCEGASKNWCSKRGDYVVCIARYLVELSVVAVGMIDLFLSLYFQFLCTYQSKVCLL